MNRKIEKLYQKFDKYLKTVDFKKFNKIIDRFKNLKIHPYYYVPQCPRCRSFVTGRYIKEHRVTEKNWIEGDTLRKGEIVQFRNMNDDKNCFCAECGYEWAGQIEFKMLNAKQVNAERIKRHTEEFLASVIEREDEELKNRSFISFSGFVGKL